MGGQEGYRGDTPQAQGTLAPRTGSPPKSAFENQKMLVRAPSTGLYSIVCGGKRVDDFDVYQDECSINSCSQKFMYYYRDFGVQSAGI